MAEQALTESRIELLSLDFDWWDALLCPSVSLSDPRIASVKLKEAPQLEVEAGEIGWDWSHCGLSSIITFVCFSDYLKCILFHYQTCIGWNWMPFESQCDSSPIILFSLQSLCVYSHSSNDSYLQFLFESLKWNMWHFNFPNSWISWYCWRC